PSPIDQRNVAAVLDLLNQAVDGELVGERCDRLSERWRGSNAFAADRAMPGRKRANGTGAGDPWELGNALVAEQRTAARGSAERAVLRQHAAQERGASRAAFAR